MACFEALVLWYNDVVGTRKLVCSRVLGQNQWWSSPKSFKNFGCPTGPAPRGNRTNIETEPLHHIPIWLGRVLMSPFSKVAKFFALKLSNFKI